MRKKSQGQPPGRDVCIKPCTVNNGVSTISYYLMSTGDRRISEPSNSRFFPFLVCFKKTLQDCLVFWEPSGCGLVFISRCFTVKVLEFAKSKECIKNLVFRIWHLTCELSKTNDLIVFLSTPIPTSCKPSRPFSSSIIPVTYVSPTTFTDPCLQQKINMFPAVVCGQKPYNLGQYPTIKKVTKLERPNLCHLGLLKIKWWFNGSLPLYKSKKYP